MANEFIKDFSHEMKEYFKNCPTKTLEIHTSDQSISSTEIPDKLCIEANDYYRRDNYRFI